MQTNGTDIIPGEMYAGYAIDESVRAAASSGGVVSALLIDLLGRSVIDGALVSRIARSSRGIDAVTETARTREEILENAGSSYIDTPVLKTVARLGESSGAFAVVALPCQVRAIRKMLALKPDLGGRIRVVIGLFCRGTVHRLFYEDLFRHLGIDPSTVTAVRVRRGHVKGAVTVTIAGGEEKRIPFGMMNGYRIAGLHATARCLGCTEHLSREADIAVGDIFTGEFKKRPIKHSAFACWTGAGAAFMNEAIERGAIVAERFGMERYRKTFKRVGRFSDRLGPRRPAARLTGISIPAGGDRAINPFHSLAWTIYYVNNRISRTSRGRRFLYALPTPLIALEAYAIKALSRL